MKTLPTNVAAHKRTDTFTEQTIPAGLLKSQVLHEVMPLGSVSFYVEFMRND